MTPLTPHPSLLTPHRRRRPSRLTPCLLLLALLPAPPDPPAYPLDGYAETGIRRLEAARLVQEGKLRGRRQPPGALLPSAEVDLRLPDRPQLTIPAAPDEVLSRQILDLLGTEAERYGIALYDLSDPDHPVYAEVNGTLRLNPGSVGKLAVATAFFQALADAWPDDLEQRRRVLKETRITADEFIHHDHHKVRLWDPDTGTLKRRPLREGDVANLWEYLDWMLSASANAAASMVLQQALLLARYGRDYPPPPWEKERFFRDTPKRELSALLSRTLQGALERNGIDLKGFRQGGFFTRQGKRRVPGTSSHATPRELMNWLLRLEQGRIVDPFSSRAIKRLLYVTERRIRYASSPALNRAAVYFKSGSLYKCREEPGFRCYKYHGNVYNYMNSVAIVEDPAGERRRFYLVTLMSNVLRKNSAVAHQTLATRIHRLIASRHGGEE